MKSDDKWQRRTMKKVMEEAFRGATIGLGVSTIFSLGFGAAYAPTGHRLAEAADLFIRYTPRAVKQSAIFFGLFALYDALRDSD